MKTYAGAKDQAKLVALLEPVRLAAEASPVVGELLTTKALFSPQAWTTENKRDTERPFAFLATFTHRLSGHSRLRHLPLPVSRRL